MANAIDLGTREAIDVEALLGWVIRVQRADAIIERGAGLHALEAAADGVKLRQVSADGVALCARLGLIGTRIDEGGWSSGELHPDAEAVYEFVQRLGQWGVAVLICARRDERPDWGEDAADEVRAVPLWRDAGPQYGADGLPREKTYHVILDARRRTVACRIQYVGDLDGYFSTAKRAEYRAWWNGLKATAEHFQKHPEALKRYRVIGPAAAAEPWVDGAPEAPRRGTVRKLPVD